MQSCITIAQCCQYDSNHQEIYREGSITMMTMEFSNHDNNNIHRATVMSGNGTTGVLTQQNNLTGVQIDGIGNRFDGYAPGQNLQRQNQSMHQHNNHNNTNQQHQQQHRSRSTNSCHYQRQEAYEPSSQRHYIINTNLPQHYHQQQQQQHQPQHQTINSLSSVAPPTPPSDCETVASSAGYGLAMSPPEIAPGWQAARQQQRQQEAEIHYSNQINYAQHNNQHQDQSNNNNNAIAHYYYDIDDGFSDILSAPPTPEPMMQPQTIISSQQYTAENNNDNYNNNYIQQQTLPANAANSLDNAINNSTCHNVQLQSQSHQKHQQNSINKNNCDSFVTKLMVHGYELNVGHINHPPITHYSAAMSPDSSALSTTSSSPCDHSLYQPSPPMSCIIDQQQHQSASKVMLNTAASPPQQPHHHLRQQHQINCQSKTDTAHGQQQQQPSQVRESNPITLHPHAQEQNLTMVRPQQQLPAVAVAAHRSSPIHLWEFLKELLQQVDSGCADSNVIRWLDRQKGVFKIEDSVRVAKLWGKRKNKPKMNYDKLSRSIRQYYKKGIMKKTDRSQRLVYQFCSAYCH